MAIIRTSEVLVIKMNEVPEELALAEGEGDLTFDYWWNGHKKYFTIELKKHGRFDKKGGDHGGRSQQKA